MKVAIAGAGIAGLTTAIALKRIGIFAEIYESAAEIKPIGAGLALAANAIKVFKKLGLDQKMMEAGRLVDFFTIYNQKGKIINRTNSKAIGKKYGTDNFTIHRASLHQALLSEIDPSTLYTGKKILDLVQKPNGITLHFEDGTQTETDFLIAADGIHSAVRKKILPNALPRYAGYTCWRAVIENPGFDLREASETWGMSGRFGITPLAHNKIYWYACINAPQNDAVVKTYTVEKLSEIFAGFHDPIPGILQHTPPQNLLLNDIIDLEPLSNYAYGNILLIGDAAHATTPNMGQGACQAIEDALILAEELKLYEDPAKAFIAFENRRIKRTHYVMERSRMLGKIAHTQNKTWAALRNFFLRRMPAKANEKQLRTLYNVHFKTTEETLDDRC